MSKCRVKFPNNFTIIHNDTNTLNGYKTDCLVKNNYCVIPSSSVKRSGIVSGYCKDSTKINEL
jgi:hypothetical protein